MLHQVFLCGVAFVFAIWTHELLDPGVGLQVSVQMALLRVLLVTALYRAQEGLVTTVDEHMFPKLLYVRHYHSTGQLLRLFEHVGTLQDFVGLSLILCREHIDQIVLALRLRHALEAIQLGIEVLAVHNGN